jgi:hypothetical protein
MLIIITINFSNIKTLNWGRQSHGLFDYESRNIVRGNLKICGEGKI